MAVIEGAVSGNLAEVDANNQMKVVLSNTPAQMGGLRNFSENDAGSKTGSALLRSPETTQDFRLRAGTDTIWDDEIFNYVAQNTTKHRRTDTTLTQAWASGYLATNAGSVTTTATGTQLATYRHFPVYGGGTAYAEQYCAISAAMGANINLDFGFMLQNTAATALPLDGVYFRWNITGVFGVMNNNGTESTTSVFSGFSPVVGQFYKFLVVVGRGGVEFWIDDVLYGTLAKPTNTGESTYSPTLPWGIRHHHTGVAAATVQLRVAGYSVSIADYSIVRLLPSQQAGMGLSSIQGASGHTQGQTSNNANSAAPVSATLSNTAAGYTTLGGQFQFAAVSGAETDYALFAFLNPAPTTSITGRNLVIRGVWIDTMNTVVAVATTATVMQWSLAVGSTAVSLATAEAAATRAPRRVSLGVQTFPVGATVGATANRINTNLDAPLVVEPNTYLHVILKMPIATATATEIFRGVVGINAYWE